jgi:hypothetical protein
MNRPSRLSLSAIIASKDAGPDSLLGLSAVSLRRLWLVVPALSALAYPSLLSLLSSGLVLVHGSASPNGVIVWVSVVASLTLALAVMLVSFVFGLALGSPHVRDDPEGCRARSIAHLGLPLPRSMWASEMSRITFFKRLQRRRLPGWCFGRWLP